VLARRLNVGARPLSSVSFNALAPCLIFHLVVTSRVGVGDIGRTALFCVIATGVMGLLARLAAVPLQLDRKGVMAFLLVVTLSNTGNYGLPVVLFAFGQEALTHATVYFVTSAMISYTVGVFIAANGTRSAGQALVGVTRVPAVYGLLAAVFVRALDLTVPTALMRPITLLADAAVPLMILVLGMQLERTTRPDRPAVVATAVALSLLVAPIVATAVASAVGLAGAAFQAGVIQASMPTAVVTTILALEFDVSPGFVTSVVSIASALSPITLTVLIAWLKM